MFLLKRAERDEESAVRSVSRRLVDRVRREPHTTIRLQLDEADVPALAEDVDRLLTDADELEISEPCRNVLLALDDELSRDLAED
jgi:hypothetical protein